jgi:ComF family protein
MGIKNLILDILFPCFCLNCGKEGKYLCEDCQALLEISGYHQIYRTKNLKDLYFVIDYQNPLIKNLIQYFKYQPFVKELGKILSSLIITHFQLLEKPPNFSDFILIPLPLDKKKLRWRGFNQAEEIGKELAKFLKIPLVTHCLTKIKETTPQVELSDEKRKENIRGAFFVKNGELIKSKKILLIDDVYTTGSTMEEAARVLKKTGAKEIIGIVIARG